jgi:hypothetical protein
MEDPMEVLAALKYIYALWLINHFQERGPFSINVFFITWCAENIKLILSRKLFY